MPGCPFPIVRISHSTRTHPPTKKPDLCSRLSRPRSPRHATLRREPQVLDCFSSPRSLVHCPKAAYARIGLLVAVADHTMPLINGQKMAWYVCVCLSALSLSPRIPTNGRKSSRPCATCRNAFCLNPAQLDCAFVIFNDADLWVVSHAFVAIVRPHATTPPSVSWSLSASPAGR